MRNFCVHQCEQCWNTSPWVYFLPRCFDFNFPSSGLYFTILPTCRRSSALPTRSAALLTARSRASCRLRLSRAPLRSRARNFAINCRLYHTGAVKKIIEIENSLHLPFWIVRFSRCAVGPEFWFGAFRFLVDVPRRFSLGGLSFAVPPRPNAPRSPASVFTQNFCIPPMNKCRACESRVHENAASPTLKIHTVRKSTFESPR